MATPIELEQTAGPGLARGRWRVIHPFRIGRAAGNELELVDPSISRRHVAIENDNGAWIVRDCGSQIGTLLNELRVDPRVGVAVHAGDVLGIGPWRFRVNALNDATEPVSHETPTRISLVSASGNLAEQRLELLLRCAGEVAAANDESTLAEALAEHAILGSGYTRALVLWGDGGNPVLRCERPAPREGESSLPYSRSLVRSAMRGEIARLEAETGGNLGRSLVNLPLRRALCAPLMLDGRAEAFLYLDSDRPAGRRHSDAPSFCHALARLAALALANLRRLAGERDRAAYAADLERAREVQHRLLPQAGGQLGAVSYAVRLHPGRVVAGDVVDVFELDQGRVAAVLGDVSGAGLGAGLVMASVQSFLRAALAHDDDPARVVGRLNAHLCAQASGGRFVTLWLGVFESDGATCRFVDAGHGHALRIRDGTVGPLAMRGAIPLGIDAAAGFVTESLELAAGEILLLHSDGVIEQRAPDGRAFGRDALADAVEKAQSPTAAIDEAWRRLGEHAGGAPPDDDATLLALARVHGTRAYS